MQDRKPLYRKILAWALCLMLLVGLMLYAMYALFTGIMEHQIYLFCRTKLDYSLNGGEAITSSVKNVHEQIYSDSRVFRLSNYDSVEASELLSGLKQMTAYRKSNAWIDSIYVYNALGETVYVSSGNAPYSLYKLQDFYDVSARELIENHRNYSFMQPVFRQVTVAYPKYETVNLVSFIRYDTLEPSERGDIVMINVRQEDFLKEFALSFRGVPATFTLIDREGTAFLPDEEGVLFSDYSQRPVIRDVLQNQDKKYLITRVDGKKQIVCWENFFSDQYLLVVSASCSSFYDLLTLQERTYLFVGLAVGGSVMLGLLFLLSKRLLAVFNKQKQQILQAEEQQRKDAQQKQRQVYLKFLNEGVGSRDILCQEFPDTFGNWRVLLFSIDRYRSCFLVEHATNSEQSLLKYGICNILEELLQPFGAVFCVYENDGTIAAICSTEQMGQDVLAWQRLKEVLRQVKQSLEVSLSVFVSDVYNNFYGSAVQYAALRDMLPYQQLLSGQSVCWSRELEERESKADLGYPETEAREIVLELMNGRFSQAALKIQAFFSLLTACSYNLYRKYLMQFIIDLDDALQKFLSNNAIGNGRAFDMQVFQLSTLETAEDIVKELQQIMARLQEAYEQKRGARQDMISLSVKELLDQNYQDPGYSLADVAPAVGMSAAYLGRLFKKQMNQSVAEYLVSVRIGNARRLLEETDLPIREISEQVGFQDITYFYRIFKNANGIPPAQYRRNQRGIRDEEGE